MGGPECCWKSQMQPDEAFALKPIQMDQKLAWPMQECFGASHAMVLNKKFREPRYHQLVGANTTEEKPRQHPVRPSEDEARQCSAPCRQCRTVERRFAGAHDDYPLVDRELKAADLARVKDFPRKVAAAFNHWDTWNREDAIANNDEVECQRLGRARIICSANRDLETRYLPRLRGHVAYLDDL